MQFVLDPSDPSGQLSRLAKQFWAQYDATRHSPHLGSAIALLRRAVAYTPSGHPDEATRLSMLATWLGMKFESTEDLRDIEEAVSLARAAKDTMLPGDVNEVGILFTLGNQLGTLYGWTGARNDIVEAVQVSKTAVEAAKPGHPRRAAALHNLGVKLGQLFDLEKAEEDINRAVEVARMAVAETLDPEERYRARRLNGLATLLGRRFDAYGRDEDGDGAVHFGRLAELVTRPSHPDRTPILVNLGKILHSRYAAAAEPEFDLLNEAITVIEEAVSQVRASPRTPVPFEVGLLLNYLALLETRFKITRGVEDLDLAIKLGRSTLAKLHDLVHLRHDAVRAALAWRLGNLFFLRFLLLDREEDLEGALSSFRRGWECENASPSVRIHHAYCAALMLVSRDQTRKNWREDYELLRGAVKLLPFASPSWLRHVDQERQLKGLSHLVGMAAAVTLNAEESALEALELLESGRSTIGGVLMNLRTDLSDLEQQHPALADRFKALRDELDSPSKWLGATDLVEDWGASAARLWRRRQADEKMKELMTEINSKPGFRNFLRLPEEAELQAQAKQGPIVVINVSIYRCDAILIRSQQPVSVRPLPDLKLLDIEANLEELRTSRASLTSTLAWLWEAVARPCLEELGLGTPPVSGDDRSWPRIWWIPTGPLSCFPLHAAGRHSSGGSAAPETVLDRAVSSYSTSLKALVHGRRQAAPRPAVGGDGSQQQQRRALIVSMGRTPERPPLRFADAEAVVVRDSLRRALGFETVQLDPGACRREEVLELLRSCSVFHFCGHGESRLTEPLESRLLLDDHRVRPLTVADLRSQWLRDAPPLAYLSACSTAAIQTASQPVEAVNLVNAFQLAGFRCVVGTLWEIDDEYSVDAAADVYRTLRDCWDGSNGLDGHAVALGVHRAARHLRNATRSVLARHILANRLDGDERAGPSLDEIEEEIMWSLGRGYAIPENGDPSIWAAYVHVGP